VRGSIVDLNAVSGGEVPSDMLSLLAEEGAFADVGRLLADPSSDFTSADSDSVLPAQQCRLLAPVPRPGKVVCLGLNYMDHAAESGQAVPSEPVVFAKAATSVIGPGEPILLPPASRKVDYEVELAFVMGRRAHAVAASEAMEFVAGYTVLNDVSARDYQMEKPGGQWYLAKSFDTFCPLGPWIVTREEVADPHDLALRCEVSGEVLQSSSTSKMFFAIPQIIEYLSKVMTLEPGDVVATGTPAGVGFARKPPRLLRDGDIVRCTVEGVGTLENPVRAEQ